MKNCLIRYSNPGLLIDMIILAHLVIVDKSTSPEFDSPTNLAFSHATEELIYTPYTKKPWVPGIYRKKEEES